MYFQEGKVYIYYQGNDAYKFTNIRRLPDRDGIQADLVRVGDGKYITRYSCTSENYHKWKRRDKLTLIRKEYIK